MFSINFSEVCLVVSWLSVALLFCNAEIDLYFHDYNERTLKIHNTLSLFLKEFKRDM